MNLFINAINLSSAGGLNVALNFLRALNQRQPDDMIVYVAAPRHCGYETLATPAMRLLWLPRGSAYWVSRLYTDYVWIPALIRKTGADVVFTMGNFATPTTVPQAVLLHYPHPAYPDERELWKRLDRLDVLNVWVRNYVFGQRLKYASILVVQTETIRDRIRDVYPQLPSISLLPNAYTQLTGQGHYELPFVKKPGLYYLVCLSQYYTHKNIEVLVEVARIIRQRGLPYRILLTIEPTQHRNARRLLNDISREKLTDVLINIGSVPTTGIPSLHSQVDGLVLPTLLESFSATYVDAMHFGVPIFTSRRDFSEAVCGLCAYYFDPLSATSIVAAIVDAFDDPLLMKEKVAIGRLRLATMPDWTKITQTGLDIIRSLHSQLPDEPVRSSVRLKKRLPSGTAHPMSAIDFHDSIATQFDHKYESSAAFGDRFSVWTALFRQYVKSTDHVLDLGCGSGVFSTYLAGQGCVVTGIDGSTEMIELCNQKIKAATVRYVVQSLPLSDPTRYERQDVIIASSLLEYIDDMERMLQQIRTILKPGGLLIVSMPNRLSLYRRTERILFATTGRPRYFGHIRNVSTEIAFNRQLTGMGFDILETTYFSSYDPLSRLLKRVLPKPYVDNLFVGVYRKT